MAESRDAREGKGKEGKESIVVGIGQTMTPPRRRERQTEVRNPSFHLLLWPRQDNRNARRSGYFIQTAACPSGRKLASPNNRHLSLYPLPPLTPSPVHSAGSFNEEISRGKYHSSSDLHFGTTARAGRRVSYQVPADVSRVRQRGSSRRCKAGEKKRTVKTDGVEGEGTA